MYLTTKQAAIILIVVAMGTAITKFLPFFIFKGGSKKHSFISFLGQVLPYSAIGLLVVYCLKDINLKSSPYGLPEAIAIVCITILHNWKESTLLSIGVGTAVYMILVQTIFV